MHDEQKLQDRWLNTDDEVVHFLRLDRKESKERVIPEGQHCYRCLSTDFQDTPIHGGHSMRRDCAKCGAFVDFPKWYETPF